jgi:predicted O-methyltransferase YrrM
VLEEDSGEPMQAFNDYVLNDERVDCVLLTVRDGILLVMKR